MTAPTTKRGRAGKAREVSAVPRVRAVTARIMWVADCTLSAHPKCNGWVPICYTKRGEAIPVAVLSMTPEAQQERVEVAQIEIETRADSCGYINMADAPDIARAVLRKLGVVK